MPESESAGRRDERVEEAIAEWFHLEEAGELPNRGAFLSRHAEIAEQLREFFADRDDFQQKAELLAPAPRLLSRKRSTRLPWRRKASLINQHCHPRWLPTVRPLPPREA